MAAVQRGARVAILETFSCSKIPGESTAAATITHEKIHPSRKP
jgi:hypothetical protein